MINKKVRISECRTVIKDGVNLLYKAVSTTMGPGGQCVLMTNLAGAHLITKDGVTVASAIKSEDNELDLVIRAIREAAEKTNRDVGDGTSTAIVLASALYLEGLKYVETGYNVTKIKDEIQKGCAKLINSLYSMRIKTDPNDTSVIKAIANISLNGDTKIANLVAEATYSAGQYGIISVEDSENSESYIDKKDGIEFNSGWTTPFFTNDRTQVDIEHEDCYLMITSYDLNNIGQLKKLETAFSDVAKEGKALIIIAREVSGGMLSNLLANNKQGTLKNVCVRSPYWGNLRMDFLQDIAVLTGATIIEAEENFPLEKVRKEHFGKLAKINIGALKTRLIGKNPDKKDIEERVNGLKKMAESIDKIADPSKIHERLAKLTEGVTVIKIGRSSYLEGMERNHRIEDSINACKAALQEGVLAGSGVPLIEACQVLDPLIPGEKILMHACEMPLRTIAQNAGNSGDIAIRMMENNKYRSDVQYWAYDAVTNSPVDAQLQGILDPFKVTRTALENAVSVASTLLTTNVIISEISEPKKNPYEYMDMYQ